MFMPVMTKPVTILSVLALFLRMAVMSTHNHTVETQLFISLLAVERWRLSESY